MVDLADDTATMGTRRVLHCLDHRNTRDTTMGIDNVSKTCTCGIVERTSPRWGDGMPSPSLRTRGTTTLASARKNNHHHKRTLVHPTGPECRHAGRNSAPRGAVEPCPERENLEDVATTRAAHTASMTPQSNQNWSTTLLLWLLWLLWFVVCGLWFAVCGLRFAVCGGGCRGCCCDGGGGRRGRGSGRGRGCHTADVSDSGGIQTPGVPATPRQPTTVGRQGLQGLSGRSPKNAANALLIFL